MNKPPPEAIHLSFEPGPYRMAMGLTACPWSDWLEIDERYTDEMALRRDLLVERRTEVTASVPGSESAARETLDTLAAHLPAQYPGWFLRDGDTLHNRLTGETWNIAVPACDPLELAARLVQEDLCIIQPQGDGPLLTAGVVCFPTRWRLLDKIGRKLVAVHDPVPFYREKLARPVDRFMAMVKPGHIAARLNWSILDDPTLFQPGGKFRTDRDERITPDNAGHSLFIRVERQTLTRLPASGAVLFTIRVHVYPLARIAGRPEIAARLADAVRGLPPETIRYKSLLRFREALLGYLDELTVAA
ncbi:MAG: heme-dependent oxidative N-demethylase family protein [Acetobacteraceae bacterium]